MILEKNIIPISAAYSHSVHITPSKLCVLMGTNLPSLPLNVELQKEGDVIYTFHLSKLNI